MALAKVWGRGQLTIPAAIRKELDLKEETPLTLVKVGEVILMTPKPLQVDSVAKKAKKEMNKSGLALEIYLRMWIGSEPVTTKNAMKRRQ